MFHSLKIGTFGQNCKSPLDGESKQHLGVKRAVYYQAVYSVCCTANDNGDDAVTHLCRRLSMLFCYCFNFRLLQRLRVCFFCPAKHEHTYNFLTLPFFKVCVHINNNKLKSGIWYMYPTRVCQAKQMDCNQSPLDHVPGRSLSGTDSS